MALSYAQLESKPQIKTTITGVQRNAQTCATKKTRTQHDRGFSCRCARRSYARDSKKRRRYGTRADRSISLRLVRGPDTVAPSAWSNAQQLRFDRNVIRSRAWPHHFFFRFRASARHFPGPCKINEIIPSAKPRTLKPRNNSSEIE